MKLAYVLLLAVVAAPADICAAPIVASTIPTNGHVTALPGQIAGWGYSISNTHPTLWLVLTNLLSDGIVEASPLNIFDFPILSPLSTLTVPFDGTSGLFAIHWNADAPSGTVNLGSFVLGGEFYDGNPLAGGAFVESAELAILPYSAVVASAVPEPPAAGVLGLLLSALAIRECLRTRRQGDC